MSFEKEMRESRFNECEHVAAGAEHVATMIVERRLWLLCCRLCEGCRVAIGVALEGPPFNAQPVQRDKG